jgi:hypothetical protein
VLEKKNSADLRVAVFVANKGRSTRPKAKKVLPGDKTTRQQIPRFTHWLQVPKNFSVAWANSLFDEQKV